MFRIFDRPSRSRPQGPLASWLFRSCLALACASLWLPADGARAQAGTEVTYPTPYTVLQRDAVGEATVPIRIEPHPVLVSASATPMPGYAGTAVASTILTWNGDHWGGLKLPSGGWYEIHLEVSVTRFSISQFFAVERVGVGEVFVTAGQSNSASHGQGATAPSFDTVAAFSLGDATNEPFWRHAYDPQPIASVGPIGEQASIWPAVGDQLVERLGIPVGFISVGVGSSRVRQWADANAFCGDSNSTVKCQDRLVEALDHQKPNGVRAVLWHQGETDAAEDYPPDLYTLKLLELIDQSRTRTGLEVPWFVAKVGRFQDVTGADKRHAIVGAQQDAIRARRRVFGGPTTDDLEMDQRIPSGGPHFSTAGLEIHARRWADLLAPAVPADQEPLDVLSSSFESSPPLGWISPTPGVFTVVDPTDAEFCGASPASGDFVPGLNGTSVGTLSGTSAGDNACQYLAGPDGLAGGGDDPSPVADELYRVRVAAGVAASAVDGGLEVTLRATNASSSTCDDEVLDSVRFNATPASPEGLEDVRLEWRSPQTLPGRPLAVGLAKPGGAATETSVDNVRAERLPVTPVAVATPSFEVPVIAHDGGIAVKIPSCPPQTPNCSPVPPLLFGGWTIDGGLSIKNPNEIDYAGAGGARTAVGMHGSQVAQLWQGVDGGGLRQAVAFETLESETWYRLSVAVGHRTGSNFGGYTIQLVALNGPADADDEILGGVVSARAPGGEGEFQDVHLDVFTTADSSSLGSTLEIRLSKNLGGAFLTEFDDVRLVKAPTVALTLTPAVGGLSPAGSSPTIVVEERVEAGGADAEILGGHRYTATVELQRQNAGGMGPVSIELFADGPGGPVNLATTDGEAGDFAGDARLTVTWSLDDVPSPALAASLVGQPLAVRIHHPGTFNIGALQIRSSDFDHGPPAMPSVVCP
ncbi:MAG: sialate O-acetylesterase [Acidobacteriota bacterium]